MTRKKPEPKIEFEKFVSERGDANAPEVEISVLGALMLEGDQIGTVSKIVKAGEVFYEPKHQIIYDAMLKLRDDSQPIDSITVMDVLIRDGKLVEGGGAYYLSSLTGKIASAAHVEKHSMILYQYFLRRSLSKYAMNLYDMANDMGVDEFETFDGAILKLESIKSAIASMQEITFPAQVDDTLKGIEDAMNGKSVTLKTGFRNVDLITGGRAKGELTIIAARPSMGKTSRAIKEIINMVLGYDYTVGLISLETKYRQIIHKMMSNMTQIDSNAIRFAHNLTLEQYSSITESASMLKTQKFLIHDTSSVNISDIKALAKKWKSERNLDALFLDYLTLVKHQNPYTKSTNDEVEKIANGLKQIAMELDIPVIALAQLNREPDRRMDKRPNLSDLRDSGAIEQAADVVSFLYRPEYYGETMDEDGNSLMGMTEELIKKNRNGTIGEAYHKFIPQTIDFQTLGFTPNYKKKSSNSYSQNGHTEEQPQITAPF